MFSIPLSTLSGFPASGSLARFRPIHWAGFFSSEFSVSGRTDFPAQFRPTSPNSSSSATPTFRIMNSPVISR
ncbi:hypothetical protein ACS0TY_018424 [Phlomoides rotata]